MVFPRRALAPVIAICAALVSISSAAAQDPSDWCPSLGSDLAWRAWDTLVHSDEALLESIRLSTLDLLTGEIEDAPPDDSTPYLQAGLAALACARYLDSLAEAGLEPPVSEDAPSPDYLRFLEASGVRPDSLSLVVPLVIDAGQQTGPEGPTPPVRAELPEGVRLPGVPPIGQPRLAELGELGPEMQHEARCGDLDQGEVEELIAQGKRTITALERSRGQVIGYDAEIDFRIKEIEGQIAAGEAYLEGCFAAPQPEAVSASIEPPAPGGIARPPAEVDGVALERKTSDLRLNAGEACPVEWVVRNTGTTTWRANEANGYGYRFTGLSEGNNNWSADIQPGDSRRVFRSNPCADLRAGATGAFGLQLVRNGRPLGEEFRISVTILRPPDRDDVALVRKTADMTVSAGEPCRIEWELRNTGTTTWRANGVDGYKIRFSGAYAEEINWSDDILPGDLPKVWLTDACAVAEAGRANPFRLQLVRQGRLYGPEFTITVTVREPPAGAWAGTWTGPFTRSGVDSTNGCPFSYDSLLTLSLTQSGSSVTGYAAWRGIIVTSLPCRTTGSYDHYYSFQGTGSASGVSAPGGSFSITLTRISATTVTGTFTLSGIPTSFTVTRG